MSRIVVRLRDSGATPSRLAVDPPVRCKVAGSPPNQRPPVVAPEFPQGHASDRTSACPSRKGCRSWRNQDVGTPRLTYRTAVQSACTRMQLGRTHEDHVLARPTPHEPTLHVGVGHPNDALSHESRPFSEDGQCVCGSHDGGFGIWASSPPKAVLVPKRPNNKFASVTVGSVPPRQ